MLRPVPAAAGSLTPRFGVNYTPRIGWFHSWLDLAPDAVAEDLAAVASLGVDHVRIFPLWPLLQPNRTLIRPRALEDVRTVVDAAAAVGLDVVVDALQGHLSSFDFVPSWLSSWHRRNMFTDPEVVSATAELVRALADQLAGCPEPPGPDHRERGQPVLGLQPSRPRPAVDRSGEGVDGDDAGCRPRRLPERDAHGRQL